MSDYIDLAKSVIALERQGLDALHRALDGPPDTAFPKAFLKAIALLKTVEGRVIVSGMGKSGHIGRKIASTFASTGTPSSFVHPAEASHGDLGMISTRDIVLVISNSGETKELADVLSYCGRFDIPIIGITSGAGSTVAKVSSACLLLPPAQEACGVTRAPTTSTTLTLALGDALAVTLLRDKGFQSEDFKTFHPGGKLGAALKRVSEIMSSGDKLPLCSPGTPVTEVTQIISDHKFGCVAVIQDNLLVGVITDGDIRRHLSANITALTAKEIMTQDPIFVRSDALATEALNLIHRRKITALFVCDNRTPIGVLHVHDFLSLGVL